MSYTWTKEDLNKARNTLFKQISKAHGEQYKSQLSLGIDDLNEVVCQMILDEKNSLLQHHYLDDQTFKKRIVDEAKFKEQYYGHYALLPKATTYLANFGPLPELNTYPLSNDDTMTFTHDFFHDLTDRRFFYAFYQQFKDAEKYTDFGKKGKFVIPIRGLNRCFVSSIDDDNIEKLGTTIHEYAHATSFIINNQHLNSIIKEIFTEIDTIFMELLSYDYAAHYFNMDRDGALMQADIANTMVEFGNTLLLKNDLLKMFLKASSLDNFIDSAQNQTGYTEDELVKLYKTTNKETFTYLISYLYAVELYMAYQQDPEKTLNTLYEFIKTDLGTNNMQQFFYKKNICLLTNIDDYNEALSLKLKFVK